MSLLGGKPIIKTEIPPLGKKECTICQIRTTLGWGFLSWERRRVERGGGSDESGSCGVRSGVNAHMSSLMVGGHKEGADVLAGNPKMKKLRLR